MGAGSAATAFEDVDQIHANFGAIGHETAPPEWVELIRVHAAAIRRVTIEWRRGSGPYVVIPGATIELPEAMPVSKSKKEEDKPLDDRGGDPAQWSQDIATARWRVGVEWAKKNGPVIDVRLGVWGFNAKKGCLEIIKGGFSAKRINLSGEQAGWMDGPTAGSMEHMNVQLMLMLNEKDKRMNEQHSEVTKLFSGVGTLIQENTNLARSLMQDRGSMGMAAMFDAQANRDWLLNMAKLQMTGEGINKAINDFAPIAKTWAENWSPAQALDPVSKIATELLETVTDEQHEKFKAASLGDLFQDLVSALKKISECKDDLEVATEIVKKILPVIVKNDDAIRPLFTAQQRAGIIALVEAVGLSTE